MDRFPADCVTGLVRVYADQPWRVDGSEFAEAFAGAATSGAVGYVHISDRQETRITFPQGGGGQKQVRYTVGLVVMYRYLIPTEPETPADWVGDLDTMLDALVDRLRADPTLGAPGVIFQAGEGDGPGTVDVVIRRDPPRRTPATVESWNVIEFTAVQIDIT